MCRKNFFNDCMRANIPQHGSSKVGKQLIIWLSRPKYTAYDRFRDQQSLMLFVSVISVTKVLLESNNYRQMSYNSCSVHFFRAQKNAGRCDEKMVVLTDCS